MNNKTLQYIIICVLLVIAVLLLLWANNKAVKDTFIVDKQAIMGKPCNIDEDCGQGNFCYNSQCWSYWKGVPMPWSTCRNPYCGSTLPYADCSASQGQCSPYCKCELNRGLGTSIQKDCFPKCGNVCMNNDNCPPGCPACVHGVCSAPNQYKPVL